MLPCTLLLPTHSFYIYIYTHIYVRTYALTLTVCSSRTCEDAVCKGYCNIFRALCDVYPCVQCTRPFSVVRLGITSETPLNSPCWVIILHPNMAIFLTMWHTTKCTVSKKVACTQKGNLVVEFTVDPNLWLCVRNMVPSEPVSLGDAWAAFPELQPLPNEDVSVGFWLQPVVHTKADADCIVWNRSHVDFSKKNIEKNLFKLSSMFNQNDDWSGICYSNI